MALVPARLNRRVRNCFDEVADSSLGVSKRLANLINKLKISFTDSIIILAS